MARERAGLLPRKPIVHSIRWQHQLAPDDVPLHWGHHRPKQTPMYRPTQQHAVGSNRQLHLVAAFSLSHVESGIGKAEEFWQRG